MRNEEGRTRVRDFVSNKTLLVTVAIGVVVNVLLVMLPPLRFALGLAELGPVHWLALFGASLSIIPIGEIYKAIYLRVKKGKSVSRRKRYSPARESA